MNKYLGRKGQGAMEYLMTYGWAILVVMVVGIVLWQLGVFTSGNQMSKTIIGFGAVKPLDWSVTSGTGGDTITLLNGEGTRINVTSITMTGQTGETCGGTQTFGIPPNADAIIEHADTRQFTMDGTTGCSGTAGASYKIQVSITYTKNIGGIIQNHNSVGTIVSLFE